MQLFVSIVGMVTSVGMVWMGRDPAIYLPITTSIIGYWLPAPKKPEAQEAVASVASVGYPPSLEDTLNTEAAAPRGNEDEDITRPPPADTTK